MAFRNDTRGVGGQKEVMNLMQNHYSALVNVKSTLNTRQAPRPHHLKNLASLQSRINFVGSKLDRKKNPHDPLSNPVFFFKKDEKDKKTSLTDFAKKVENNLEKRQEKNKEMLEMMLSKMSEKDQKKLMRPVSAIHY